MDCYSLLVSAFFTYFNSWWSKISGKSSVLLFISMILLCCEESSGSTWFEIFSGHFSIFKNTNRFTGFLMELKRKFSKKSQSPEIIWLKCILLPIQKIFKSWSKSMFNVHFIYKAHIIQQMLTTVLYMKQCRITIKSLWKFYIIIAHKLK